MQISAKNLNKFRVNHSFIFIVVQQTDVTMSQRPNSDKAGPLPKVSWCLSYTLVLFHFKN